MSVVALVTAAVGAGAVGFALGALGAAHRIRTGRAAWEPRFAAGASPQEAVRPVRATDFAAAAAGGATGACSGGIAAAAFVAAAGVAAAYVGRRFALARLFPGGLCPEEADARAVFRNAPPIKTYDPSVRPKVLSADERRGDAP
jgi:hypothetical protein